MDDAKEGFIYFSLGCSVQALNVHNNKILVEIFRELPYKILWKHTEEVPDGVPDNVKIVNWTPQQDVLSMYDQICLILSYTRNFYFRTS